jgi:hypothetical protein
VGECWATWDDALDQGPTGGISQNGVRYEKNSRGVQEFDELMSIDIDAGREIDNDRA